MKIIPSVVIIALAFLSILSSQVVGEGQKNDSSISFRQAANELIDVENSYLDDRLNSRWQKIYDRQHPDFRKNITLKDFIDKEGLIAYRDNEKKKRVNFGIGNTMPWLMPESSVHRDMLGFPVPSRYRIYANPWVKIIDHRVKRVSITEDSRFARVDIELDVEERLDPSLFKVNMVIPHTRKFSDFFELLNGRWAVSRMVHKTGISGVKHKALLVPENLAELSNENFISFDANSLKTKQSKNDFKP